MASKERYSWAQEKAIGDNKLEAAKQEQVDYRSHSDEDEFCDAEDDLDKEEVFDNPRSRYAQLIEKNEDTRATRGRLLELFDLGLTDFNANVGAL